MEIIKRKAALTAGLARYFTGKPCLHGHICERFVCDFNCVECRRSACQKYYIANREKLKGVTKQWYANNLEEKKERDRIYRSDHKEYYDEYIKVYREANPDRLRIYHQNRRARLSTAFGKLTCQQAANILKGGRVCNICGKRFSKKNPPHMDHVIPITHVLGTNDASNIAPVHKSCNSMKRASLFNPITKQGYLL